MKRMHRHYKSPNISFTRLLHVVIGSSSNDVQCEIVFNKPDLPATSHTTHTRPNMLLLSIIKYDNKHKPRRTRRANGRDKRGEKRTKEAPYFRSALTPLARRSLVHAIHSLPARQ